MFTRIVTSAFSFLETEYGFKQNLLNSRAMQYERGDCFITVFSSDLDEISLRLGTLSRGFDNGFSAGTLIALSSPSEGFALRDRMASRQIDVEQAVAELASIIRVHGQRLLNGDETVFTEMQRMVDARWNNRRDSIIRQRAVAAFAAKDFAEALKHYHQLGDRRKPLDTKRMQICEKRLS